MFEQKIRPLLVKFCAGCHAPGEMQGLDFLLAKTQADLVKSRGLYASVFEQIESGAMPPSKDEFTDSDRTLLSNWLKTTLELKPIDYERIAPYVVEVFEDSKGNLWMGTMRKGAARFDGKKLSWFTKEDGLTGNVISSFAEDKAGNIWMGSHTGLTRYDGKTFTKMWETTGRPDEGDGWMGVRSDKNGDIWTSTNGDVFRYDGKSFSKFKLPIRKNKIDSYSITAGRASLALEDKKGNLWFRTDGNGAYKFDGKSFTHFSKKEGLCSNNVTSILEDQKGNIWFTCIQSFQPKMTGDGGVCRYDGKSFTKFSDVKGLSQNDIYSIYQTKSGDIWIGASRVGAYRYDGNKFRLFDKTDRPHWTRYFGVQSILEDRHGTLWFGFSGGLFQFTGQSFINVTKAGPWKKQDSNIPRPPRPQSKK